MESDTVWRALASPHRRKLLDLLKDGPLTTGQLSKELPDLTRFAVMQHLGVLEEAGLVLFRKEGRSRFNYLNPAPVRQTLERWLTPRSSIAAETALHLKRYAENTKEVAPKVDPNTYRLVKIEMELIIAAPREKVFAALTHELDNWWPHRYKPDSKVSVDLTVGGKIEEVFADGGGALYGIFTYLDAPHKIAASGPSSMHKGLASFTVDTLETSGDGTLFKRETQMWGTVPEEVEAMFRDGTRQMMETALVAYVVDGKRYEVEK